MARPSPVKSRHDQGIARRFLVDALRDRLASRRRQRQQKRLDAAGDDRHPAALIFGAGAQPGIGAAIASRAAQEGYRVYVTGRSRDKLDATVAAMTAAGGQAQAMTVDVAHPEQIDAAFAAVAEAGCRLELVVHNVGSNRPCAFLDLTPAWLEAAWVNDCRSGFLVGQHAIRAMLEQADLGNGRGTVLFTGASASLRGKAHFAAFAQAKAGLRMLAQALAREYGPQGIHVAHVIIDGLVDGARLRRHLSELVDAQGPDGALDPAAIADAYWAVHTQQRSAWTQELDLRPYKEAW